MSNIKRQTTFLRWYLERTHNLEKNQRSVKLLKRSVSLLLILGIWIFAFYANYFNPSNWYFVKKAYHNVFIIFAIILMVVYTIFRDFLEYRIVQRIDRTDEQEIGTIRHRYQKAYGKDIFFRLHFLTLAGSFLCGLIGIIILCVDLANKR